MSVAEFFETMDYGPAPESDAEARAWLKSHDASFGHFINGAFVKAAAQIETREPATGAVLAKIANGSAADVDAAVQAAKAAYPKWSKLSGPARARHLYALARMLQRHARLFAVLESLDNGKPIRETRDLDVPLAARHFYHHAGWAKLADTELKDYAPLGVVGQIIPWNFPLLMLSWKVAPALAAGNTVVLKPAEFTPLTALLFAELSAKAGLPAGRPERGHRRRRHRSCRRRPPRHRQDRLHRLNRRGPPDSRPNRGNGKIPHAGTGRQVAVHRV